MATQPFIHPAASTSAIGDSAPRTNSSAAGGSPPRPHAEPLWLADWAHGGWLARFALNLALQDWIVLFYFSVLTAALCLGDGPDRPACLTKVAVDVALVLGGLALTRGRILPEASRLSALVYRITLFGAVFLTYFQLRDILPAVRAENVDATILSFDLRVFHYEPSVAWDRFVNPTTTEWFAFFYFSYFAILALHVLPYLFAVRNMKLVAEFAIGIVVVFSCAHILYMVVPGYGPYRQLEFQHPLSGGLFWSLVWKTVQAGGAQKDIFPSLHTAAPSYLAIFAFRHRGEMPFKFIWPVLGFFAFQIILATMFLRWHYLVDIVAGLTLASLANLLAAVAPPREARRRQLLGLLPVITDLWAASSRP